MLALDERFVQAARHGAAVASRPTHRRPEVPLTDTFTTTPVLLTALTDGPLELCGPLEIADAQGNRIKPPGDPVYLCRCGRSGNKPFCDGSHARTGWTERA
jgi:hypothetical protein